MARVPNFEAGASIARMEPFKSNTGSLRGVQGSEGTGRLPQKEAELMRSRKVSYTVYSYGTPIAYHHEGQWHYPDVSYSNTTSRHQSIVRGALGIKNAREQRAEANATKRAQMQKDKEQTLWDS